MTTTRQYDLLPELWRLIPLAASFSLPASDDCLKRPRQIANGSRPNAFSEINREILLFAAGSGGAGGPSSGAISPPDFRPLQARPRPKPWTWCAPFTTRRTACRSNGACWRDGAPTDAIEFAVALGWVIIEAGHAICLTDGENFARPGS
jgi:hypothetical protein